MYFRKTKVIVSYYCIMNYLGHLFFSNNSHELMLNNLYGDYVKGKDLSRFPLAIQKGILLHREIDHFIDHFPQVLDLQHQLQSELPKVSSIAIDLYFDHLLAKNWNEYHPIPLAQYLNAFYSSIEFDFNFHSEKFQIMIKEMIRVNWPIYYPELDGLDKMCNGVSKKISFENKLKFGKSVFEKHEAIIYQTFRTYMEAASIKFNVAFPK